MSAPAPGSARAPQPGDPPGDLRGELLRRLAAASERGVEADGISDGDSLRDDLGLDSLDAILLVLELEEWLEVDVEDEELAALDTVGSLIELIEAKARGADTPP